VCEIKGAALGRPPFYERATAQEGEIEMSMRVRYPNGFEGVASDKVAEILEQKGAAKIIGEAKEEPKPAKEKKAKE
jgi:hypothetical protein